MTVRRIWSRRPLGRQPILTGALLILAGTLTGLAVVVFPALAWALIGGALILLLVRVPAPFRVGSAVLAAASSRLLVATGFFPPSLNFFHFPLALLAALVAALETRERPALSRGLGIGLLGLLAACLLSWIVNGGQPIRPWLDWLVFAEPFLIVYALCAVPPDPRGLKALWGLALSISLLQLPLALYQALSLGLADHVQGSYVGLGAGAHVAGGVVLLGSLVSLAHAIAVARLKGRALWLLGGALLFAVAVLADAKQVIVVFLPALILLLLGLLKLRRTRVLAAIPVLTIVVLGAFSYYQPLRMALDWTLISRGILGKAQAFAVIASRLSSNPSGWIFGLGPGNSVSRVALMGLESYIMSDSPVRLLGLAPSRTTIELWSLTSSNWLFASSSVWSSASSWLGLLGDLGLGGLGLYLWLHRSIWRGFQPSGGWQVQVARSVLLMCVLLGFMYSWLEEPGFMLPAALIIGLGMASGRLRAAGSEK